MISLGLVDVTPPEKRMAPENSSSVTVVVALLLALTPALLVTLFLTEKSFSELCCPYDIGEVNHIAHSLTDLEK